MSDGYGDPIPPGHGEPRVHDGGKVYEISDISPFETTTSPALPAQLPPDQFGTPLCGRCFYYHAPEEACRR